MALTLKADGLNPENLFTAAWVNDFTKLLTGVMNDQPVTLNYRPGSGSTPTLTLKTDGRPLIRGFKSDNTTQAFNIDQNGNLTLAGALTLVGAVSGITTLSTSGAATLNSVKTGTIQAADGTAAISIANSTGILTLSAGLKINGSKNVLYAETGLSGKFTAQATAPSSPADGDLWLDTSVVLS